MGKAPGPPVDPFGQRTIGRSEARQPGKRKLARNPARIRPAREIAIARAWPLELNFSGLSFRHPTDATWHRGIVSGARPVREITDDERQKNLSVKQEEDGP